ncbi:hypothetical protein NPIL_639711 [Nephila pilipes]|uniref:Uncharacterized protein n=1 Tax=Nephila pilipes TaxID=299642 RepID=A0A8X6JRH8_NEPPI|nr:hypothetical protein NPIL_639711 [Nephila pilipes]
MALLGYGSPRVRPMGPILKRVVSLNSAILYEHFDMSHDSVRLRRLVGVSKNAAWWNRATSQNLVNHVRSGPETFLLPLGPKWGLIFIFSPEKTPGMHFKIPGP